MTKAVTRFYVDGWDKLKPEERDTLTQKAANANPGQPVEGCASKDITRLDGDTGWFDATLEANHWFALPEVAPADAALLLCQYNPNESTFDDARRFANGETGPRELVQLQQRFVALQATEPGTRTLRDWLVAARSMGLKYHSWIEGYAETLPAPATIPTPAPSPTEPMGSVSNVPAPLSRKRAERLTWQDVAMPYVVSTFKSGQYAKTKDFYAELMRKTGVGSPFDTGTGGNRGSLFVRDIQKVLTLKTLENAMPTIRRSKN